MKIGFIGTGIMGTSMATHLLNAGHEVSVYNRTKSKAQSLISQGAKWFDTPAQLAKENEIVITIVGYPKDVEEVYLGDNGLIANAKEGTYLIDMTTSSPTLAKKIYEEAKIKGIHAVDAPVTGGDRGAKNATLTIFVGGEESSFKFLKPVFEIMGKSINYMGEASNGQKAKISNQIALAGSLIGACEAFAYAQAAGLDINKVFNSISTGSAGSVQMTDIVKRGLDGDFKPGFMLKHLCKDLAIGAETALEYEATLPINAMVLHSLKRMEELGHGDEGTQALLKYYNVIDED